MADDQPVFEGIDAAIEHFQEQERPEPENADISAEQAELEDTSDEDAPESELEETKEEDEDGELTEESDEDESEEDESDEDDPEDDEAEEYLFKVGEGEDEVVVRTVEEAKEGFLRQSDYTKKTQALSSERKAVEAEKTELMTLKSQYLEGLNQLNMAASEELSQFVGIDWQQLQKDDPYEFEDKKTAFEAAQLAYQQSTEQKAQLQNELLEEQRQQIEKIRSEELEQLKQFVPEAGTPEFNKSVMDFAVNTYGADPQVLSSIVDHVALRVLVDAKKYHDRQNSLQGGKKKVVEIQKSTKQKASKSKQTSKARQAKARKNALRKEGGLTPEEVMSILG